MESKPEVKWKPGSAQTLLWCCFCDARFEKPAQLSTHLDRYDVNWKLYWRLYYSGRDGKACVLCNILHADRKSLECHFKMVHCIGGSCPKREPDVITLEAGPSHECPVKPSPEGVAADDSSHDGGPRHPQLENEQEGPQVVRPDAIEDIDVLFEINPAATVEIETSSVIARDSTHLPPPSTSSGKDQPPGLRSGVQLSLQNIERLPSPCQAPRDGEIVIPHDVGSMPLTCANAISVLQSDDEVEELESDGIDLLSSCKPEAVIGLEAQTVLEGHENSGIITVEDDDSVIPVEASQQTEVVPSVVDPLPNANFPAEGKQARPTAVVNPFGAHREKCVAVGRECEGDAANHPPYAVLPPPESSLAATSRRTGPTTHVQGSSAALGGDLIAVVHDDDNIDTDTGAALSYPIRNRSRDCRTPPHAPGDFERELEEHWANPAVPLVKPDVPDLSRLTPSKIAAYMNKDIFSAKHQSDIQKHLDIRASADPLSRASKELPVEACSDTDSDDWDDDSEGSRASRENIPDRGEYTGSEPRAAESLPLGFNIVNVKSLLHQPTVSERMGKRMDVEQQTEVSKNAKHWSEEDGNGPSHKRVLRKRTLSKPPDGVTGPSSTPACNEREDQRDVSPTQHKKSRNDLSSEETQLPSCGSKEVFKQPMALCVGVVHPGSLVEVSAANVTRTAGARGSLDGIVMKAETIDSAVRYFIHFPNMDRRLDCWVSSEDIVQVYRTEGEATQQVVSSAVPSPSPGDQTKRRLAFELSPESRPLKSASSAQVAHEHPETSMSARHPPKTSRRSRASDGRYAAGGNRQAIKSRDMLARAREARARLAESRKKVKAAAGRQPRRASRYKAHVRTGRATETVGQADKDVPNEARLRPRLVRLTVPEADVGRSGSSDTEANPPSADDAQTTFHPRQRERVVRSGGEESTATRGRPLKARAAGEATESFGGNASSQAIAVREDSSEKEGEGVGVNASADPASKVGLSTSQGSSAGRKRRRGRSRKAQSEPPPGIAIRRVTEAMLDSLQPGILVYVICTVFKNDWLRLYPARIEEVLDENQFHVHYLGYKSSDDEMIAAELIHSIMDVEEKMHPTSLRASWLVKSSDQRLLKENKETTSTSATCRTGQSSQSLPSSGASKHQLLAAKNTQACETSSVEGSCPSQKQGKIKVPLKAPPPTLDCGPPSRLTSTSSETLPESPPMIAQEKAPAPATRSRTATGDRSKVDFWAAVADVIVGNTKTPSRSLTPRNVAPVALPNDQDATPPAGLHGSAVNDAGVAKAPVPKATSSKKCRVSVTRRHPGRSKQVEPSSSPPPASNVSQPPESGAHSPEARMLTAAQPRHVWSAERLMTPPAGSAAQLPGRHAASVPKRRGRPLKSSATSTGEEAAGQSTIKPAGTSAVPVETLSEPTPEHLREYQDASSGSEVKKKRGRPRKKIVLMSKSAKKPSSPVMQIAVPESNTAGAMSADSAAPCACPIAPPKNSGITSSTKRPQHPPKKSVETPSEASEVAEEPPQRRSLRSGAPTASLKEFAPVPVAPAPSPPPPPPAQAVPITAVATDEGQDCAADRSGPASKDLIPCTKKDLRRLKGGDIVYVVYEAKEDGTKTIYPAKVMQVNRDLYYARFLIHYLGWGQRYDEWITEDVIYSVVDRSQPNFSVKSLKSRTVSSPRRRELLALIRPCSVDLSVSNICFFSALRKDHLSVNDKRILALRAQATERRKGSGGASDR